MDKRDVNHHMKKISLYMHLNERNLSRSDIVVI